MQLRRNSWLTIPLAALILGGCAAPSPYVGVSVPVGPISVGVGASGNGVSASAGTGMGPVGVGVGVNQRGQVTGSAGVGASTRIGSSNARAGVGVGTGAVLYDPNAPKNTSTDRIQATTPSTTGSIQQQQRNSAPATRQWRDASGNIVPTCKIEGLC